MTVSRASASKNLWLATIGFAVAFACWGTIAGIAPLLKQELGLTGLQTSIMISIPVLLASLGRIPMGILTDRFGGRLVFSLLLILGIIPCLALAVNYSYLSLLFWGLWLGMAGTSFAVGIAFVSHWFAPDKQGTVLGIFGVGNAGQSVAVLLGPIWAGTIGIAQTFVRFGLVSLLWGIIFALYARDARLDSCQPPAKVTVQLFSQSRLPWVLGLFYALTFGGFVTLSLYLPILYVETFELPATTAGGLTAAFVAIATLSRPLGGWLSDRLGGRKLLYFVFLGISGLGWMIAIPHFGLFNFAVFATALLLGLGNAGVFKLVPEVFPKETGSITGLVGAAGGLGGFFPPIGLGILQDLVGSYAGGFILLSCFGLMCFGLLKQTSFRQKLVVDLAPPSI